MAKRKQPNISPIVFKLIFVLLIVLTVFFLIQQAVVNYFWTSPYFKIKTIEVEDPNLRQLIQEDLAKYRGRSIFGVKVEDVARQLSGRYPQITSLKVIKRLPNEIAVVAKKRFPVMQIMHRSKYITLDNQGVVIGTTPSLDPNLIFCQGVKLNNVFISSGMIVKEERIAQTLNILNLFRKTSGLSNVKIMKINAESLSAIEFYLSNDFKVIFDKDSIDGKMPILSMMLTSGQLNMAQLSYIDLRFNEPILGKRESL